MAGRLTKVGAILCLAAGSLTCSKTEDTAPERRIFGSPPSIASVEVTNNPTMFTCDWTQQMKNALFCFGINVEASTLPNPFPTITLRVSHNEVQFQVRATDPESTPSQSDILLVTASYLTNLDSSPQEISLVVLDDGSSNQFQFQQGTDFYGVDCTAQPTECDIGCMRGQFVLDSNDLTAGDGLFTRGFSFVNNTGDVPAGNRAGNLFQDCLVSQSKQAPAFAEGLGGRPVSFKIEAIDRSGNIATWPVQPEVAIQAATFTCEGDMCACCLLTNDTPSLPANPSDPNAEFRGCAGLPGLIGQPGSGYECGLCNVIQHRVNNPCATCTDPQQPCPP